LESNVPDGAIRYHRLHPHLVKKALKKPQSTGTIRFGIWRINKTFTSINTFINAIFIYALDVAICVGQYLVPSYTKQTGDQDDI
jgi:hypothetical protein